MHADIIGRFHAALPQIRSWIDSYIESQAAKALKLQSLQPLGFAFPPEVFERARMVLVDRTPFPPASQFGLPEFAAHERRAFDGITFKNTLFVVDGRQTLRLQFHELVHTVQWARLGDDRFLLAYGLGLLQFGYENSPLERMAFALEEQFVRGPLFQLSSSGLSRRVATPYGIRPRRSSASPNSMHDALRQA